MRTAAVAALLAAGVLGLGALLSDETGRRVVHASMADEAPWSAADPSPALPGSSGVLTHLATADGMSLSTASPFPGLFYGRPAGIGLVALAVVTFAALWVVANRPAVATEDERIESALRRVSAHRVLRTAVGGSLVVTGGLMAVGGMAMANVDLLPVSGLVGAVPGLLTTIAGLVVSCVRAPGVPADEPTSV
ncbi:hypothetical protein [uncultured Modestobacter sp.]|uniref:hypothetical protein n=1 Tax=uncultured Modestobacter sp. TaxID=380048 RepID=UPI00261BF396|nr:hypothetical protein [uncultured Modestobacter sp.]